MKPEKRESSTAIDDRKIDVIWTVIASALTVFYFSKFHAISAFLSEDMTVYFLPWYQHVLDHGRWASLEGSFVVYTPPYVYVLSLCSLLNHVFSAHIIVKLVPLSFFLPSAYLFWSICRKLGCSQRRSLLAAWILLVSPELIANSLLYAQIDIMYTTFLLLFLRFLLEGKPGWAMAAIGVSLSIKLQTIFAFPFILALLLTGELPAWSLLLAPVLYLLVMVPAHLAGRTWTQLVLVYSQQYGVYDEVAMLVANPYMLLPPIKPSIQGAVIHGALVIGAICTLALLIFLYQLRPLGRGVKLVAAFGLTLLVEPYVLPKMHDRYFFAGNIVVLLIAMIVPRMAVAAALLQASALMAYFSFLTHLTRGFPGRKFWAIAVAMVGISIFLLVQQLYRTRTSAFSGHDLPVSAAVP